MTKKKRTEHLSTLFAKHPKTMTIKVSLPTRIVSSMAASAVPPRIKAPCGTINSHLHVRENMTNQEKNDALDSAVSAWLECIFG